MTKIRIFWLVAALVLSAHATEEPHRIAPEKASPNLLKRIEPTVPQLAKAVGLGGTVVLDITVSASGKVSSVRAISGSPILVQAFIDAVRQWEYRPFLDGGQPISIVTRVEWSVPSPYRTKTEEKALRDYYPAFQACYGLVHAGNDAAAEKKCSEAVRLSDELPVERLIERSSSRTFFAHSLLDQGKLDDAIPFYEKALEIRRGVEGGDHDADFAGEHANLARAYFLSGQLDKADPLYARAITIFEAAIIALPEEKKHYSDWLKRTLLEYSRLKNARGEPGQARELEEKAAALQTN